MPSLLEVRSRRVRARRWKAAAASLFSLGALAACSDVEGGNPGEDAGSGGSATGGTSSGGASAGGAPMNPAGGASTGGASSSGGSETSTGGAATGGNSSSPAVPSAGCGLGGRPSGGAATGTNYIANFPEGYDGSTPQPMVLGLHAHGNPITQIQTLTNGSRLAEHFVRLFPKSEGSGWDYAKDKARLDAVFEDVFARYCIDTSRVYVTGHSSGAGMAVQLLCNGDDRFAGAAPVAAWKACGDVDPIPTMYIQGIADAQRGGGNGKDVVDVFASSNSCSATTTPFSEVTSCTSGFNGKSVTPGCVSYQGCGEPLVWCSHDDEGYNSTDGHYHGWPCFASNAMADFFLDLE